MLKRASTGSRALPGAVRRVYSGVSARIMRRKEYTDLGVLPHDNPGSRNVPRDHVKRTVMGTYTSYLLWFNWFFYHSSSYNFSTENFQGLPPEAIPAFLQNLQNSAGYNIAKPIARPAAYHPYHRPSHQPPQRHLPPNAHHTLQQLFYRGPYLTGEFERSFFFYFFFYLFFLFLFFSPPFFVFFFFLFLFIYLFQYEIHPSRVKRRNRKKARGSRHFQLCRVEKVNEQTPHTVR